MNRREAATLFFERYSAHDTEGMMALCTPNAAFRYVPLGDSGAGTVREQGVAIWRRYIEAFPDFRSEIVKRREGDDSVTCEAVNSGTQSKDIAGVANKGRSFRVPHLYILDFDSSGFIEAITCYWDNDSIYAQLGHTEPHE